MRSASARPMGLVAMTIRLKINQSNRGSLRKHASMHLPVNSHTTWRIATDAEEAANRPPCRHHRQTGSGTPSASRRCTANEHDTGDRLCTAVAAHPVSSADPTTTVTPWDGT